MMYLIYMLAMILVIMAAKKGRGRGKRAMGRYMKGTVNEVLDLGTLAGLTAIGAIFDETVIERTKVSSIVATYSLSGFTPVDSVGPITVGISHSDYTQTEIEEWIENTGSWNAGDLIQQETANRKIRRIGTFDAPASAALDTVLNDGKPIKTKLNWILNTGQTLRVWAYNTGSAAVQTTDPQVIIDGHVNLFPQ